MQNSFRRFCCTVIKGLQKSSPPIRLCGCRISLWSLPLHVPDRPESFYIRELISYNPVYCPCEWFRLRRGGGTKNCSDARWREGGETQATCLRYEKQRETGEEGKWARQGTGETGARKTRGVRRCLPEAVQCLHFDLQSSNVSVAHPPITVITEMRRALLMASHVTMSLKVRGPRPQLDAAYGATGKQMGFDGPGQTGYEL